LCAALLIILLDVHLLRHFLLLFDEVEIIHSPLGRGEENKGNRESAFGLVREREKGRCSQGSLTTRSGDVDEYVDKNNEK